MIEANIRIRYPCISVESPVCGDDFVVVVAEVPVLAVIPILAVVPVLAPEFALVALFVTAFVGVFFVVFFAVFFVLFSFVFFLVAAAFFFSFTVKCAVAVPLSETISKLCLPAERLAT